MKLTFKYIYNLKTYSMNVSLFYLNLNLVFLKSIQILEIALKLNCLVQCFKEIINLARHVAEAEVSDILPELVEVAKGLLFHFLQLRNDYYSLAGTLRCLEVEELFIVILKLRK